MKIVSKKKKHLTTLQTDALQHLLRRQLGFDADPHHFSPVNKMEALKEFSPKLPTAPLSGYDLCLD